MHFSGSAFLFRTMKVAFAVGALTAAALGPAAAQSPPPSQPELTSNESAVAASLFPALSLTNTTAASQLDSGLSALSGPALAKALNLMSGSPTGTGSPTASMSNRALLRQVAQDTASSQDQTSGIETAWDRPANLGIVALPPPPEPRGKEGERTTSAVQVLPLEVNRWSAFATGFGGGGDMDGTSETPGSDFDTAGLAAGFGYLVTDTLGLGLAAGGSWTDLDTDELGAHTEISSFSIGVNAAQAFGAFHAGLAVMYAHHDFDSRRHMVFGGLDLTAKGSHAGDEIDTAFEFGYTAALDVVTLQPYFNLAYTNLDEESFTEHEAAPVDLGVDSKNTESLHTALGLRLATSFGDKVKFTPVVSAHWEHETIDDDLDTHARFVDLVGQPRFTVSGIDRDEDVAAVGVAFLLDVTPQVRLGLTYEGRFGDVETSHIGRGLVEVHW